VAFINTREVVHCRGNPGLRRVAITFDDGPSEPYTSRVLDILDEYQVKATFFMVGRNVEKFPEVARGVAGAGHEIGNHTHNHSSLLLDTPRRIAMELAMGEEAIVRGTGVTPRLFRPPYGANTRWIVTQALRRGYVVTKWSVNAGDWRKASAERIARKTLSRVGNGAIILMHDGTSLRGGNNHRWGTVSALPMILDALKTSGYEMVGVSELLGLGEFSSDKAQSSKGT
jgi:peptidoglycan/xylan/chitin deacetylase (PgdA/CDA1 family)